MNLQIVPLRPEHSAIAPHLRQADIEEIYASGWTSPTLAVAYSIARSEHGAAVLLDRKPCAVFGVDGNIIWLVATEEVANHPVTFYRLSRRIFHKLSKGCNCLENFVYYKNTLSLRWLQWLGFHIEQKQGLFHHVWWKGV